MSNPKIHKGPHQYQKFRQGNGVFIWRCTLGCPHFLREDQIKFREARCPRCDETYIMGKHEMELIKPHCKDCTKPKLKKQVALSPLPEESPL